MKLSTITTACLGLVALAQTAHASLSYTLNPNNTITVAWDEAFIMDLGSTQLVQPYLFLISKNLFNSNGSESGSNGSVLSISQTVSINGGTAQAVTAWGGWEYRPGSENNYSSNDAAFGLNTSSLPTFASGDTLEWTGTMTVPASTPVYRLPDNAAPTSSYLANYSVTASNVVNASPAPEPSASVLCAAGAALLGGWRLFANRRRANA